MNYQTKKENFQNYSYSKEEIALLQKEEDELFRELKQSEELANKEGWLTEEKFLSKVYNMLKQ